MKGQPKRVVAASAVLWLAGCATHYTVDDGRKVDEVLLKEIRTYAQGTQALRPAIVRSADLHDKECSTQWELPFDTATSYAVKGDDAKVAWVRGAGVDEHLRVIATSPVADVAPGDIIQAVDGYDSKNAIKMTVRLDKLRDEGDPFDMTLANGKPVHVTPLKVCRGRTLLAQPGKHAEMQDYRWLRSIHPEQIATVPLTPDEAQWVVLWTQGLSEEGGFRMKAYTFSVGVVKLGAVAALTVATLGAGAAAGGAAMAAGASLGSAVGAVAAAEAPFVAAQIAAEAVANSATLHGVSWVASSAFDKADRWAFDRMTLLGMDPRAGEVLEQKLASAGASRNAFLLDDERQKQMDALVKGVPPTAPQHEAAAGPAVPPDAGAAPGVEVGAVTTDAVSSSALSAGPADAASQPVAPQAAPEPTAVSNADPGLSTPN
ncbi:hypothetical protein [Burkholderia sp. PU8-34]